MTKNHVNFGSHIVISIAIGITILSHLLASTVWAGPNISAGCALDLDISTRNYDSGISEIDIERSRNANPNEQITVGVVAQNVANLDTYEVIIEYDPAHMTFVGGYEDSPMMGIENILKANGGSTIGFQATDDTSGLINISNALTYSRTEEAPEGSGVIALLQFKVIDDSECNNISIMRASYQDSNNLLDKITERMHASINGNLQECFHEHNDPPVISDIENQTIFMNSQKDIQFTINDAQTSSENLVIMKESTNYALMPTNQILISCNDNNCTATLSPVQDELGRADITLTVVDEGQMSSSSTFQILVKETEGKTPEPNSNGNSDDGGGGCFINSVFSYPGLMNLFR
jgi:hypothetical protein